MMSMPYQAKRFGKAVRNLFADPLPRNRTIALVAARSNSCGVDFCYMAMGKRFRVRLNLDPSLGERIADLPMVPRDQALAAIGIAFVPFFFKLTDFRRVVVETTSLDPESQAFFARFLRCGLGEFRYLQGLNPARRIEVCASAAGRMRPVELDTRDHLLMLNGGGKDTIVAGELLKASGQPFSWLTIRPNRTRRRVIELSGNSNAIEVGYEVDEEIERLKAYPWGHVPHTSIVLSIGLLVAMLSGSRYVAAGNEHSANFGNLRYRGFEVNHQYTKSFEFERGFADFAARCVTPSVRVFSILRPFHDLQLAQLFANHVTYLPHFISCNRGIHHGVWCKECPKCAFTALALSPFVSADMMHTIFGEDVLQRPQIRRHIIDLVSGGTKPWECVGTREECALALHLLLERNPDLRFNGDPGREALEAAIKGVDVAYLRASILDETQPDHAIPPSLVERLNPCLQQVSAPVIRPIQV